MATPAASGSLDKPGGYAPGATMTATLNYSDPDTKTGTVTFTVQDSAGNSSTPVVLPYKIDPSTVSYTDSLGKTWTKQSDNGSVAVFTATA